MTMLRTLFSILTLLILAACGGGSNTGGTPFGGPGGAASGGGTGAPPSSAVADLVVLLSAATIPNTGTGTVTVTVTALDANRNAVSGAAVTLSANAGAVLTVNGTLGSITDSTGRITATVAIGSDQTNRDITVTAVSGAITRTATLRVVDSPVGSVPSTIELIAEATTLGTGGDGVVIRAFVKDSNNNALANTAVSFRTSTGTLSSVSTTTDASGLATATLSAGADKSNRSALITVSSGAVSNQITLPVTGTRLTLSGPSSLILGNTAIFDVVVTDSRNNVVPNVTVTASSTLGNAVVASGGSVSNSSGQVRFMYTATNAGTDTLIFAGAGATATPLPALVVSGQDFMFVSPAASALVPVNTTQPVQVRLRSGGAGLAGVTVSFAATGGTLSAVTDVTNANGIATVSISSASAGPVTVQASVAAGASTTLPLLIVATTPSRLVLQVSPTALAPNLGTSTTSQAQVVAKVTDAVGNPVQGQVVNFTRDVDPSGGNLLQVSDTTDTSGQATVAYRAGAESTANNGVVLRATVATAPAVTGTATLTVNQTALFIALGTGNVISNIDEQTYRKDWTVYVTDSNGIAVNGVTLTIKALPTFYLTGRLLWNGTTHVYSSPIYSCRNEDANANGVLNTGEDDNGDSVLWPGNVIAVSPGTVQTVNGRATISLAYAESYAPWVQLRLTASATVSGTESSTSAEFIVSGSGPDFSEQTVPPAGVVSPFGLLRKPGAICTQVQ